MLGFAMGLDAGRTSAQRREEQPIVAWGDSLTAGGYPALAGALFSPERAILNRGIGGQTSTQIAARQGGRPIVVTVANDIIPAATRKIWNFSGGTAGWFASSFDAGETSKITLSNVGSNAIRISTSGGAAGGSARVFLGSQIGLGLVPDTVITARMTISENTAGTAYEIGVIQTGDLNGGGGTWFSQNRSFASSGRSTVVNVASGTPGAYLALAVWISGNPARSLLLSDPEITIVTPVAVTAKNINLLYNSGNYSGTISGTLAGVHGIISTDSSGNWTFARDDFGPAIACPSGSTFVLDEATSLRDRTAWIWAGRNNWSDPAAVKSDIAAMIGHLGHDRYLVSSILNGNYVGEFAGTAGYATLMQLNADLASLYGSRFVGIREALISAADPIADAVWIERDTVPASLRSDNIHLNAAGYMIAAQKMHAATAMFGW